LRLNYFGTCKQGIIIMPGHLDIVLGWERKAVNKGGGSDMDLLSSGSKEPGLKRTLWVVSSPTFCGKE
jgi:hypothetical protein